MRLADVLDICSVKVVRVPPEVSLAEAVRAMHRDNAEIILVEGRPYSILSGGDIFRLLTSASPPTVAWNGPVTTVPGQEIKTISPEEAVSQVIEKMTAAETGHMFVATAPETVVVSLLRLLLVENAFLHGEVHHLQTYIDALHDAPND
jgi:CBS domain-containing protein